MLVEEVRDDTAGVSPDGGKEARWTCLERRRDVEKREGTPGVGVSAGCPRSTISEPDFPTTAAIFHLRPGGGEGTEGSSLSKRRGPGRQTDPFAGLVAALMPTQVTNVFLEILELGVVRSLI